MNIRFLEGQAGDPLQERRNALAKTAAILAADAIAPFEPAASVSYRSGGRTLVVGSSLQALAWAEHLASSLPVTLLLLDNVDVGERLYPVFVARAVAVAGWLGAFEARWQAPGQPAQQGKFDLVLRPVAEPADFDPSASARLLRAGPRRRRAPRGRRRDDGDDGRLRQAEVFRLQGAPVRPQPQRPDRLQRLHRDLLGQSHRRRRRPRQGQSLPVRRLRRLRHRLPDGRDELQLSVAAHTGSRIKAALRAYGEAGGQDPVLLLHSDGGAPCSRLQSTPCPAA
jgi:hypothetical protein